MLSGVDQQHYEENSYPHMGDWALWCWANQLTLLSTSTRGLWVQWLPKKIKIKKKKILITWREIKNSSNLKTTLVVKPVVQVIRIGSSRVLRRRPGLSDFISRGLSLVDRTKTRTPQRWLFISCCVSCYIKPLKLSSGAGQQIYSSRLKFFRPYRPWTPPY